PDLPAAVLPDEVVSDDRPLRAHARHPVPREHPDAPQRDTSTTPIERIDAKRDDADPEPNRTSTAPERGAQLFEVRELGADDLLAAIPARNPRKHVRGCGLVERQQPITQLHEADRGSPRTFTCADCRRIGWTVHAPRSGLLNLRPVDRTACRRRIAK